MSAPPQVLRIKRKRNEEPLQALLFENPPNRKKTRTSGQSDYVFKLARTERSLREKLPFVLNPEAQSTKGRKIFSLPKLSARSRQSPKRPQTASEPQVNSELLEMVDDYLRSDEARIEEHRLQKRRKSSSSQGVRPVLRRPKDDRSAGDINHEEEYVYDVYYRDKAISDEVEKGNIGYVRFSEDDLDLLEDDEEPDSGIVTDDEDSNSENYYQNEYPEDEDGDYDEGEVEIGESDEDQDETFDIIDDKKQFARLNHGLDRSVTDADYERMTGNVSEMISKSAAAEESVDSSGYMGKSSGFEGDSSEYMDTDETGDETGDSEAVHFERHQFFASDRDDPLAIHRDRIFGRLQGMIGRGGRGAGEGSG
ncbi:DEKNAAC102825 [Brettanomyces naardenensis]|uniref:Probable RNA polymerase II nuclear localization protein SLC7A6OS n=1 Tax=Brettanomyces naardenensis TaxID=13370 RepID=A0A448YLQ8_BRENA|nr:DEKNAAC102825 [Brettanomyces naardenensis]